MLDTEEATPHHHGHQAATLLRTRGVGQMVVSNASIRPRVAQATAAAAANRRLPLLRRLLRLRPLIR